MASDIPSAIAVVGPTATGKSAVAEHLAVKLGCRIVNADAFQVYRGLDVGTNKSRSTDRYELLDILEPWESFSVGQFVEQAERILSTEFEAGRDVVVVGGTGLYVRALFEGYTEIASKPDPNLRAKLVAEYYDLGPEAFAESYGIDPETVSRSTILNSRHFVRQVERRLVPVVRRARPQFNGRFLKFGLELDKHELDQRIDARVVSMVQNGWLEEVSALRARGASKDWPGMRAIGYCLLLDCLNEEISLDKAIEGIQAQTRRYAKRQMTWLRREPNVHWLDAKKTPAELTEEIISVMQLKQGGCDGKGD
jgi:tRNA dimethylallyltransferase